MTAPLAKCTGEEHRALIRFLWSEGVSGLKFTRGSKHNMETAPYPKEVRTSGLKSLKVAGQAWTTQKE